MPSSEQGQLQQVAQGCSPLGFEYLQGWGLYSLPGQPVFNHLHGKEDFFSSFFSYAQREPHMFQFVPIEFWPVTGHLQEEPGSVCFTPSLQIFVHIDKIAPSFSSPGCEQSQLSQPLLRMKDAPSTPLIISVAFTGLDLVGPCVSCTGDPKLDPAL